MTHGAGYNLDPDCRHPRLIASMQEDVRARLPDPAHATRFWWIRHAPVPEAATHMYGSLDLDCTVSDTARFKGVAARLPSDAHWVTSPMKRAMQTAEALLDAGASVGSREVDPDIAEMDFGALNGLTLSELFAQREDPYIGYWPLDPHEQAPDGESFELLARRVQRFMNRMQLERRGQNIVCVSHRGTIRTSVAFNIDNVSLTCMTHHDDADVGGPGYRLSEVGWLP